MHIDARPNQHGIKARPYDWKEKDGTAIPGVGLITDGHHLVRHLTTTQAIDLANQLADAVEASEERRRNP